MSSIEEVKELIEKLKSCPPSGIHEYLSPIPPFNERFGKGCTLQKSKYIFYPDMFGSGRIK